MKEPVIGVSCDMLTLDGERTLAVPEQYLLPLVAIGARPRLLPSIGGETPDELLDGLDGLLLTGAVSNVEPRHYGGAELDCPPFDPDRDATTLPLIRACLERGTPLLAICRGMQELNVALGGTLHPRIHEIPGRIDHRAPEGQPLEVQFALRHKVELSGQLASLAGGATEFMVNSLHWQGIDKLANGLTVEAKAPDGTIEAIRVEAARSFAVGVQWHPEWRFSEDPLSLKLFYSFAKLIKA
jgi:putative glutamine amidotransferase